MTGSNTVYSYTPNVAFLLSDLAFSTAVIFFFPWTISNQMRPCWVSAKVLLLLKNELVLVLHLEIDIPSDEK